MPLKSVFRLNFISILSLSSCTCCPNPSHSCAVFLFLFFGPLKVLSFRQFLFLPVWPVFLHPLAVLLPSLFGPLSLFYGISRSLFLRSVLLCVISYMMLNYSKSFLTSLIHFLFFVVSIEDSMCLLLSYVLPFFWGVRKTVVFVSWSCKLICMFNFFS